MNDDLSKEDLVEISSGKSKSKKLLWMCERCGGLIGYRYGALTVSLRDCQRAEKHWREAHREYKRILAAQQGVISLAQLEEHTSWQPSEWFAYHHSCLPAALLDNPDNYYTIELHRINTEARLLWWTAHIMHKKWAEYTNWDRLLYRFGEDA